MADRETLYVYTAVTDSGRRVRGYVVASSREEAPRLAEVRGHYVTSIKKKNRFLVNRIPISPKLLAVFFDSLGKFIASGVDIQSALDLVGRDTFNPRLALTVYRIRQAVTEGFSLAAAFKMAGIFPDEVVAMIRVGEESGKIAAVFENLKKYYEEKERIQKNAISALFYPVVVLLMAFGGTVFIIPRVVKPLRDVFARFGSVYGGRVELPLPTKIVMGIYEFLSRWGVPALVALVLAILLGAIWVRRSERARYLWHRVLMRSPLIGGFYARLFLYRFFLAFTLLFEAGVPVREIVAFQRDLARFEPVRRELDRVIEAIDRGMSFSRALHGAEIFPEAARVILRVGEESGRMLSAAESLTEYAREQFLAYTRFLTGSLAPAAIIVAGILVGGVVLACYLPLFQLMDLMKQVH